MAIKSGITLTETDPANIDTPSTGKITIFQDATMSPPQPAYKSEDGSVSSLVGPPGPEGPAGPTGSITVNPNGALDGDGSGGSPLGVRVDGVTIGINASNELEAVGGGSGTVVNDVALTAGATVVGAGGAHVVVDTVTSDLVDRTAGVLGSVSVGSGLQKSAGTLSANVDNETIGTDSNGKLQVIANYILKGVVRLGLHFVNGWLDVNVDNETIGIDSQNKLQVLPRYVIANSAGVVPASQGGGLVLLTTVTANASTTLDFATRTAPGMSGALFQSDFDVYLIEMQSLVVNTNGVELEMRVSTDGGATYNSTSVYGVGNIEGNQGSFLVTLNGGLVQTFWDIVNVVANTAGNAVDGHIKIYNPLSETLHKRITFHTGTFKNDGNFYVNIGAGRWAALTAVNAFRLFPSSGNFTSGTVRVYGMGK